MKLTVVILFIAILQVAAAGYAQKFTLNERKVSIAQVFQEINKQTGYDVFYLPKVINTGKTIQANFTNASLEEVMKACLADQDLTYTIDQKTIVIRAKEKKTQESFPERVLSIDVSGRVVGENELPLPGATVKLKGSNRIVTTNERGEFLFSNVEEKATFVISYLGYETKTINVFGKEMGMIRLIISNSKLDEIQVIAYGTTTQRYNLGSVSKIGSADMEKQAHSNPLSALQGRVAGLVVNMASGLPGASIQVQVRGQNTLMPTLGAANPIDQPLFIIDGVPFAPQNGNINQMASAQSPGVGAIFNNPRGGFSPFNSINPADIESIEVLKDADATAIYGSRGGNGVVLITTKKGETGKTGFQLNFSEGMSSIGKTMPMMSTEQYLEMRKEAIANGNFTPNLTQSSAGYALDLLVFDQNKYTDWKDFLLGGTAKNTVLNTSVSGGTNKTQFRLGGGYNRTTYIYPGAYADKRANVLVNLNHTSNDHKFAMSFSANYSYNKNASSGSRDILTAFLLEPNYPDLMDANGNIVWTYQGHSMGRGGSRNNPLTYLKSTYYLQNNHLNSNFLLSYEVVKNLKVKTSFGYSLFDNSEYYGNPKVAQNPVFSTTASANFGKNRYSTTIIEPQIDYHKVVGPHRFDVLLGGTYQYNDNERTLISASGYTNDNLIGSISAATTKNITDGFSEYKYAAVFSRINYRYHNRYLLNLTARRDGSSRFGPGKQFGNFGSVGLGWLFSEEDFMKTSLPFLSYGKLRSTLGITGSDATADYQYLSRWAASSNTYDGQSGFIPQNLFNSTLSWASTQKTELGLELGFFKDRLLLNTAYYRNKSGNQLVTYRLPAMTGFVTLPTNWEATVANTGLEMTLQSVNIQKEKGLRWTSSLNMTFPQNKLIAFPNLAISSYNLTYVEGKSLNSVFGFNYAGVNEQTGLFQFYKADGTISSTPRQASGGQFNDYIVIGHLDPKLFGGLMNSFSYKGFHLDVFLEFRKQLGINYLRQVYSLIPGLAMNLPATFMDRWQKSGDQAQFQRLTTEYTGAYVAGTNFYNSNGVYSDASYIRLKNVALSYSFNDVFGNKMGIPNLRLFCNAQNLFTITNYLGNDPETQSFYGVPLMKTVVFGLQLSL